MTRWLANLNVSRKLALGFALVLLLTLLNTLSSWVGMSNILQRSDKLDEISGLIAATKDLRISRLRYQANRDESSKREMLSSLDNLQLLQEALSSQFHDPADQALLRQQKELASAYQEPLNQLIQTFANRESARQQLVGAAQQIGLGLDQTLASLAEPSLNPAEQSQRQALLHQVASAALQVQQARLQALAYTSSDDPNQERGASEAIRQAVSLLEEQRQRLPAAYQAGVQASLGALQGYQEALAHYSAELTRSLAVRQTMVQSGDQIDSLSKSLAEQQTRKLEEESARSRSIMAGAALLALLLGTVAAIVITRLIVRPLLDTLDAAERIAAGDLSQDIRVTRDDELGQLQRSMQDMTLSLRELIGHIRDGVTQIASAAEELSCVTEQTSAGVNSQKVETDQVATAMHEMAATVQEVARNAEDASESANAADRQAKEGEVAVSDAVAQMDRLADEVLRSNEAVGLLKQESEKIGSVLDVIKAVAEQTNLLALNAAIEAARAGEAGRGFAVVADEVRGLAQRTQKSTEEIEALIGSLQTGTQQAANLMDSSREMTGNTVELTRRAGQQLSEIARSVSSIQAMNQQIAAAAEEQSAVAEEINRSVVNVRDISEQTAAASEETAASSVELARLGNDLQLLVSRFRT
ncbi:chemotaxis protein [Pseudomonas alcaligenes]|uniref:Chemotaxis protein n=1 Tax=Aquipseudomonas alcaligenes TaxID=43263 RepID=A0ABR7S651_AQUAC|nr:methyl-accepting chemotaxis protein [Pseudomonas alcaligenes]MBC9252502.1 chemotaxis protein [Pseudomonas alcaligenes]